MFPKKVIAALCAAVLALAMPTMAFAAGGGSGSSGQDGQLKTVSFQDKNGGTWELAASYRDDSNNWVDIDIALTNTTLAGLPKSEGELFYQTFDLTSSTYQEGQEVQVHIYAPEGQYSGTTVNFLVNHNDGTSQRFSGYINQNIGDGYYFSMNKLCTVAATTSGFASTGSSASGSTGSGSQSGTTATGTLSPKTGVDMDGQLFAIAACGIAAAGISIVVIRRMVHSK